ncbi:MAG TPA: SRPBCC family protein [Solirubrobacteraceae bacterium]|nr:SRPBCC family protein [Solirubrobacteraceae bacterium]
MRPRGARGAGGAASPLGGNRRRAGTPPTEVAETLVVSAPPERLWAVLSDTGRYADWVETCEEVTYHHGAAALGGVYKEVGHGPGPLPVHTTWRVAELQEGGPRWYRRDTGTGMPLVTALESIFELEPVGEDGPTAGATRFTWRHRYRPALGALGRRIDALQQGELRAMMRRSMARLAGLVAAEPVATEPVATEGVGAEPVATEVVADPEPEGR